MPTLDELLKETQVSVEAPKKNLDDLLSEGEPAENQRPLEDKLNLDELLLLSKAQPEMVEEASSAWDQFRYAFDKAGNITSYAADILESYFPLGQITFDLTEGFDYIPPDEAYGKEYDTATPEQRRELIMQQKLQALEAKYGDFKEDSDSLASSLGEVAKGIADPTSVLPVGATYKTIAAAAGALGAGYSVLEDIATNQDVDPEKAAIIGGSSAVLAPVTTAVVRTAASRITNRAAQKKIDQAQKAIDKKINEGYEPRDLTRLLQEEGIDLVKLKDAQVKLNKKLVIPVKANPAEKAADIAITKDSAVSRLYSPAVDKYLGTLSTRVRNISEPVFGRLRRFEFNTHLNTQNKAKQVDPFLQKLSKVNPAIKSSITRHLYNSNFAAAEGLMRRVDPELSASFQPVKTLLNETKEELLASGHSFTGIENYFPRKVKDVNKLLDSLGKEPQSSIQKALKEYAEKKKTTVSLLDSDEKAEIIDLVLRGYRVTTDGAKPSFVKPRTIQYIPEEMMQFYATPEESLHTYIRRAVNDIEKRKFFGRASEESIGRFDNQASIGKFVQQEIDAGNIPQSKQDELVDLLQSRFVAGEQGPGAAVSSIRDLGYMGTIANPISAITQLGDMGISAALNGMRNTFKSFFGAVTGSREAKLIDIGLDEVISQELSNPSKVSSALNFTLKAGAFKTFDRLGKETYINAALKKSKALARTDKGVEALRKKWGNIFGDEFESFVADLRSNSMSDNVKYYLFNEISDVQPVSLSEMPQAYLEAETGRVLYMLKSFMLKQYDIIRRNVYQEFASGNKTKAVKTMATLAAYMTAANTGTSVIKDFILGREVTPEDIPGRAMWSLLGIYGINKYTSERYLQRGDIKGAFINTIVPATPIIDAAVKLGKELPKDDPNIETTLKAVPVVGPIVYNWFAGGAEKFNERLNAGPYKKGLPELLEIEDVRQ